MRNITKRSCIPRTRINVWVKWPNYEVKLKKKSPLFYGQLMRFRMSFLFYYCSQSYFHRWVNMSNTVLSDWSEDLALATCMTTLWSRDQEVCVLVFGEFHIVWLTCTSQMFPCSCRHWMNKLSTLSQPLIYIGEHHKIWLKKPEKWYYTMWFNGSWLMRNFTV